MNRLKRLLAAAKKRLSVKNRRLKHARRRHKRCLAAASRQSIRALAAEAEADRRRTKGHSGRRMDRTAQKHHRAARKAFDRAQWWTGRIKELLRARSGVLADIQEREKELAKLQRENKVKLHVTENKVTGGTVGQRFKAAALLSAKRCGNGKRRNFYSQPGIYSVGYCFTGEPAGYRSDCSQWFASVCKAAGMSDPNGQNWKAGYTGTLVQGHGGWRQVSVGDMRMRGWGMVIYGSGPGHHVEAFVGPSDKTIGHGSAPIDAGRIDLFGDGNYRCFVHK